MPRHKSLFKIGVQCNIFIVTCIMKLVLFEKCFIRCVDICSCLELCSDSSICITQYFRSKSKMKLIDKLVNGLDVYKTCPSYEKPVGFFSSKIIFTEINDIFVTNHRLLMDTTDIYRKTPTKEKIKIGRIYAIERALLHFIAAHGSFYRYDDRKGKSVNGFIPPILSKNQLLTTTPVAGEKLTSNTLNSIFELLETKWTEDYPSFRDLHNFLSDLFAKRHGLKASQVSPNKSDPKSFKAKCLRNIADCDNDLENIFALTQKISDQIIKGRFDVIEVHYGYNWQKIGNSDWYLNIDTFLSLRSRDINNVLNTHAVSKFGENVGSIHTRFSGNIIPILPGFGTPIRQTSTQVSGANSREATIDLITDSASSSHSSTIVINDNTNLPRDQDNNENNSDSEKMKYCGAEQCNIMCSEKEFCANTGKPGLCESVKCVTFNV